MSTMGMMGCGHNVRYEIREEIPDPEHHPIGDVAVVRYCARCAIDNYQQAERELHAARAQVQRLRAYLTGCARHFERYNDYSMAAYCAEILRETEPQP